MKLSVIKLKYSLRSYMARLLLILIYAKEHIIIYKNSYSNIIKLKKNNRVSLKKCLKLHFSLRLTVSHTYVTVLNINLLKCITLTGLTGLKLLASLRSSLRDGSSLRYGALHSSLSLLAILA